MRRVVSTMLSLGVVAGLGLTLAPSTAFAADSSSSMLTAVGGSTASGVSASSTLVQQTAGPVSVSGSVTETIQQNIDITKTRVKGVASGGSTVPDINTPVGWTTQYFDGSAWSGTAPAYDAGTGTFPTLAGIKTTGTFTSGGLVAGAQSITRTATGTVQTGVNFSGSSGGDGWDVFYGASKLFSIFHHSSDSNNSVTLDCHTRTGAACWASTFSMSGYSSSAFSTGFYDATNDRIYSFAVRQSDARLGLTCAQDVSTAVPSACATAFVDFGAAGGSSSYYGGQAVRIGDKIYMRGAASGQPLLCFDIATSAKCGGTGLVTSGLTGDGDWTNNRLLAVGTKVFVSTGTQLGCFDTSTAAMCSGFGTSGLVTGTTLRALFYTTDGSGNATQVCAYRNGACWNATTGASGTLPSGFTAYNSSNSIWDGWGVLTNVGTKVFYYDGNNSACFDFSTNALCAGFTPTNMGSYPYATSQDPENSACLWSNSNSGTIKSYTLATGATPCTRQDTVVLSYSDADPLLACAEADRVSAWTSLKVISPTGSTSTSATVSISDTNGSPITGWQNLSVALTTDASDATKKSGTLSLTGLPVSSSTRRPSFSITYTGMADATGGSGTFVLTQGPPALCTNVKVQTVSVSCLTGTGSGAADFPYGGPAVTFDSSVTITPGGGSPTTETSNASATRAATLTSANCLTTLTGFVYRGSTATPIAGSTVTLMGPSGSTGLTATTAADGSYTFSDIYPDTYGARAESTNGSTRVAPYINGGGTQLPDVIVPIPSSGGGSTTTVPVTAPSLPLPTTPIAPIAPGTNPNLPIGGLPLGHSVVLVNGQSATAVVIPDVPTGNAVATGLMVTGDDFTMRLTGMGTQERPLGLTPDGALILEADRRAHVSGTGFLPNSDVNLYVFSDPRYMGTVHTDASGNFDGSVPVPMDLAGGRHTLQSNGYTPDGAVRSLSLGVQVNSSSPTAKTAVTGSVVTFDALSAALSPAMRVKLDALAKHTARTAVAVTIVGYVQDSGSAANNVSLSLKRARAIATYLKTRGVMVVPTLQAAGVAQEMSPYARRAIVTVRYRV